MRQSKTNDTGAGSAAVPLTRGPAFHWFGYYDKLQFDPSGRYALGMEVGFEHRSPRPEDVIRIGMIDLQEGNRWTDLGDSRAWCWQQGCMLQWRPGSDREVLWNDREGDRFVCRLLDVRSGRMRTVPFPIYTVSPDGRTAFYPDFRRINDTRPGYGYAGLPDPNGSVGAPVDSGLWRGDLETGATELIASLADIAGLPYPGGDLSGAVHWFNHLLASPDGARLEFLHRWRFPGERGFHTRMLTVAPDGSAARVVADRGQISHFIWRDPRHILAFTYPPSGAPAFYLYPDGAGAPVPVGEGVMKRDGHCSYLPGGEWILNDAYPDQDRRQSLYLYHVPDGRAVELARFPAPPEYDGEWRCDLHPRFSPDGRVVVVDSAHEGGRQMYAIDIGAVVGPAPNRAGGE